MGAYVQCAYTLLELNKLFLWIFETTKFLYSRYCYSFSSLKICKYEHRYYYYVYHGYSSINKAANIDLNITSRGSNIQQWRMKGGPVFAL